MSFLFYRNAFRAEPVTRYSKFCERSEQQIWETSRKWDKFRFLWVELYVGTAHSQKAKSAKITLNTTFKVIFYKCYFSYQYGKSKPLPYDFNLWYLNTARFSHFIDSLRNSPVDCFIVSLFLMRARHIVFLCQSDIFGSNLWLVKKLLLFGDPDWNSVFVKRATDGRPYGLFQNLTHNCTADFEWYKVSDDEARFIHLINNLKRRRIIDGVVFLNFYKD